ncbi:MAG: DNA sulfur modification protein DndB [Isosphaeraceae bacterium]
MATFELHLPAIRGKQAGHEFYLVMCPLRIVPRLFRLEEDEIEPELQAQRVLNKRRIPEFAGYITDNPDSYVLSSIVGSIDREVSFDPASDYAEATGLGVVKLPISARLLIHDGLHRRAAIETALRIKPELGDETISLVLYVDPGFRRSEQIFSDLKRHEARSARSQGILCDTRDELALIAKELVKRVDVFEGMTEMVRSKISNRSLKLFTLSGIYHATRILMPPMQAIPFAQKLNFATDFWSEVAGQVPDWSRAKRREVSPAVLRATCVHSHALALSALARVGRSLVKIDRAKWRTRLGPLRRLDWSRSNRQLWEGRAMIAGRLSKSNTSILLTGNIIKRKLRLPLTPEEQQAEELFNARDGR